MNFLSKKDNNELKNKLRNKIIGQQVSRMNKQYRTKIVDENKEKLNEHLQLKRDEEFKNQESRRIESITATKMETSEIATKLVLDNFEELVSKFDGNNLPDLSSESDNDDN